MTAHARAQIGRALRLPLFVLLTLIGTTPFLHSAETRWPALVAVPTILELLWRELYPAVPLPSRPTPDQIRAYGSLYTGAIAQAMTTGEPLSSDRVPPVKPPQ